MKTDNSIFIRVLLWAYNKQQDGFTREELRDSLQLEGEILTWVNQMFFWGTNDDRPLVSHLLSKDGKDYFSLTDKGMSAAIGYLELREARKSGELALIIALSAIVIGVLIGLIQIGIALHQKSSNIIPEDYSIPYSTTK